jgi:hypothetical protein
MRDTTASPTSRERRLARLNPVQRWIALHDHSLLFGLSYVALTISLSIMISYFWLLALVALHILLEWLKKGYLGYRPGLHRISWTLWDTKFDIALIFLALTLLSYTGVGLGAAGTQSAARVGVIGGHASVAGGHTAALGGWLAPIIGRLSSVFASVGPYLSRLGPLGQILQRGGFKIADLLFSARVAMFRKADMRRAARTEHSDDAPAHFPWQAPLGGYGWFALTLIGVNIVAVSLSPLLTDHSWSSLLETLLRRFHPWP